MKSKRRIIQIGNLTEQKGFSNPQTGRVYSVHGLSPTLNTCGGGQREPKVIIYGKKNKNKTSDKTRMD